MQSLFKNLAFAFSLALLLWLGYIVFFQNSDSAVVSTASNEATVAASAFVAKLAELKEIKLDADSAILSDPRFQSLIDQHQNVDPQPFGRPNPFESTGLKK